MANIVEHNGFRLGEYVICILNNRSNLTVGKEYKIKSIDVIDDDFWIAVDNDRGWATDYHNTRFISKSDFRNHLIKEILK